MTRPGSMRTRRSQGGLSLVELMIAMVLGLVVVAAAYNTYIGTSRSARFNNGLQTLQENGRYGIGVLQNDLRLAGYSPTGLLLPVDIAASSANSITARSTAPYDCGGGDTTLAADAGVAVNTYTFVPPIGGEVSSGFITCTGNVSAAPVRLVDNVEAFRVLYGLTTDYDGPHIPERFVPWDATVDPGQVVALRVALLVNSGTAIRRRDVEQTHVVLDTRIDSNDAIARNVYSATIALRNTRD